MKQNFYSIYIAAHNNAVELLNEAKLLYEKEHFSRAYFLGFTALEEIAKSQLAADVYTGLLKEEEFFIKYDKHDRKIKNIVWAYLDANEFRDENGQLIIVSKPKINKRMLALYVDFDKQGQTILPQNSVREKDAKEIIHIVKIVLHQIMVNTKYYGQQIGTKGFMK